MAAARLTSYRSMQPAAPLLCPQGREILTGGIHEHISSGTGPLTRAQLRWQGLDHPISLLGRLFTNRHPCLHFWFLFFLHLVAGSALRVRKVTPASRCCSPQRTTFSKPFTPSVCSPFHPPGLLLGMLSHSSSSRPGLATRPACVPAPPHTGRSLGSRPQLHAYRLIIRTGQPHPPYSPHTSDASLVVS